MTVLPYVMICVRRRSSALVVYHKVSGSKISRMVWPRITKFYAYIHTGLLYCHTGYDIINYFWSEVIMKKPLKMLLAMPSGGIS